MRYFLFLLFLVLIVQAGYSQRDTTNIAQSILTQKVKDHQIQGGWHSSLEGRKIFFDVSKRGTVKIDLQEGMLKTHQQIVDVTENEILLYPIY